MAELTQRFSTYYNRHQGCWCWRERKPSPYAEQLGYQTRGVGFQSQSHALAAVRYELQKRKQAEQEAAS